MVALVFSAMARLILEDGSEYRGKLFGAAKSTPGEVGKYLKEKDVFSVKCRELSVHTVHSR